VPGKGFFSQLNTVRSTLKHNGLFPDPKQWFRVGEKTYAYLSAWCENYLGLRLDAIDESSLIADNSVKARYAAAVTALASGSYRLCLEELAQAADSLFNNVKGLRHLSVGRSRAEDAIKLAAFGVHGNDYLALQEFLPSMRRDADGARHIVWEQKKYGHPGNWTEEAASFCVKTFVDVALRIQDSPWIPGAFEFGILYEHQIVALTDGVRIVQERGIGQSGSPEQVVIRTLNRGEVLRGQVSTKSTTWVEAMLGQRPTAILSIMNLDEKLFGDVEANKVRVTCVPRDHPLIHEHFPDLPEVEFDASTS
jgi:hypothetical protein